MYLQLTIDAVRAGVLRMYKALPDIQLDLPAAYALAERWIAAARHMHIIDEATALALPRG